MITIIRYSQARTKAQMLIEIADADSRDHGVGGSFGGLCVAILAGQTWRPALPKVYGWVARYEDYAAATPQHLAAYLHTQGCRNRTMWQMDVDEADVLGYCYRVAGSTPKVVQMDGIVLRHGAQIKNLKKVAAR